MTQREYSQKAADGTLTVRDVMQNTEYATAEQLAMVSGGNKRKLYYNCMNAVNRHGQFRPLDIVGRSVARHREQIITENVEQTADLWQRMFDDNKNNGK